MSRWIDGQINTKDKTANSTPAVGRWQQSNPDTASTPVQSSNDSTSESGSFLRNTFDTIKSIGTGVLKSLNPFDPKTREQFNAGTLQTIGSLERGGSLLANKAGFTSLSESLKKKADEDAVLSSVLDKSLNSGKQYKSFSEAIRDPEYVRSGFTRALSSFAPAGIAGLATGGTGAPAIFGTLGAGTVAALIEGGQAYNQASDYGVKDEKLKEKIAGGVGVINGALESIGIGELLKRSAVGNIIKRKLVSAILERVGRQGLVEGSTEGLQQIVSNSAAEVYNKNQKLFEGVPESAFFGALTGGLMSIGEENIAGAKETAKQTQELYNTLTPGEKQAGRIRNPFAVSREDVIKGKTPSPLVEDINQIPSKKTDIQKTIEQSINPAPETITVNENKALKNQIKLEQSSSKESFKTGITEGMGRGEVTGYFEGEKAGKKLGEKIGEFKTEQKLLPKARETITNIQTKFKSKELMQKAAEQYVRNNLPVADRGVFLNRVLKATTPTNISKVIADASNVITENKLTEELNKTKGKLRSKIGFVKMVAEFQPLTIRDAKQTIGIDKPIAKMQPSELDTLYNELKKRYEFKRTRGFRTLDELQQDVRLDDNFYKQASEAQKSQKSQKKTFFQRRKDNLKSAKAGIDYVLTPISTQLQRIDQSLKNAVRKLEFNIISKSNAQLKEVSDYVNKASLIKKNDEDSSIYKAAALNGDIEKIKEIHAKYGITDEQYNKVRDTLDEIHDRANSMDMEIGYIKDYFPRLVKDKEGLYQAIYNDTTGTFSPILDAVKQRELKLGRELTGDEKIKIINSLLRGFSTDAILLKKPGFSKKRQIKIIPPEWLPFYEDPNSALIKYIAGMNQQLEARAFFGKNVKNSPEAGDMDIEASIGHYVLDLISEGKIKPGTEDLKVQKILTAYFNNQKSPFASGLKNLMYITTLNNPLNAITNLKDLALSAYRNPGGIFKTVAKIAAGKPTISVEELGLEGAIQEMTEGGKFDGWLKKQLKFTGFSRLDRLGKESYITSVIDKYIKAAKTNVNKDVLERISRIFGKDTFKVLSDLKAGNITDDVKYLAFNEIADLQPIAISEMPPGYANAKGGKIMYALKSFSIKQIDFIRNEALTDIKSGNKSKAIRGVGRLFGILSLLALWGATIDEIKNFITGQTVKFSDNVANNLFQTFFLSKYSIDKLTEGDFKGWLGDLILPPLRPIEYGVKDFASIMNGKSIADIQSARLIPGVGDLYYWWLGGGVKTREKQAKQAEKDKAVAQIDAGDEIADATETTDAGDTMEDSSVDKQDAGD